MKKKNNVIIITGEIGSGKTTLISEISSWLKKSGIKTGGIIAPAVYEQENKTGYTIIDIATGNKMRLSQITEIEGMPRVGKYFFISEALDFGLNALSAESNREAQIVLIDEIGAWELQDQGWASGLNELIIHCDMPLIISVRRSFVELVVENWMFKNPLVIEAKDASPDKTFQEILKFAGLS